MKIFLLLFFRGLVADESTIHEVQSRDIEHLDIPPKAFGFQFFDANAAGDADRMNLSPTYYYGGRVMSIDQARRELPDPDVYLAAMLQSGYEKVIVCRHGNVKPFLPGDILIEIK
jgi:hypothetical protein